MTVVLVDYSVLMTGYVKEQSYGSKDGAVVRALVSQQCGSVSNPGVEAMCGLNLWLVLSLAPRCFSPGTPVFPSPKNQHT